MAGYKYKLGNHCAFALNYHLVWTPKRRVSVLVGNIEADLRELVKQKCESINVEVITLEVMPDHVHIFVSSPPTLSPHKIVKDLKGVTSNFLRKKYPQLLKMSCLWSSSYYAGSVGQMSESVVKLYIESQKTK